MALCGAWKDLNLVLIEVAACECYFITKSLKKKNKTKQQQNEQKKKRELLPLS